MTQECQSKDQEQAATPFLAKAICTRVSEKNALALDLRRIHAQSIRCNSLTLPLVLCAKAQAALMRAAELLEQEEDEAGFGL